MAFYIAIMMHRSCFEDINWILVAADLVPVFEAVLNTNYIIGHMWSHLGRPPVSKQFSLVWL